MFSTSLVFVPKLEHGNCGIVPYVRINGKYYLCTMKGVEFVVRRLCIVGMGVFFLGFELYVRM